jgi:protein-S-isoprenylcysteine O-methyltransferase Ste14
MFQMQGLGIYQMSQLKIINFFEYFYEDFYEDFDILLIVVILSTLLIVVGTCIKVWATYIAGLDVYYYKDMFIHLPNPNGPLIKGIYKYINSPMYGLGNIQSYGVALINQSILGIIGSAFLSYKYICF